MSGTIPPSPPAKTWDKKMEEWDKKDKETEEERKKKYLFLSYVGAAVVVLGAFVYFICLHFALWPTLSGIGNHIGKASGLDGAIGYKICLGIAGSIIIYALYRVAVGGFIFYDDKFDGRESLKKLLRGLPKV